MPENNYKYAKQIIVLKLQNSITIKTKTKNLLIRIFNYF